MSRAAEVTVRLPTVLADMVGGTKQWEVRGDTVGEALRDLARCRPALAVHFFDDVGSLRRHILCFHGDFYARGREALERPIRTGDTITILNSVAGG